MREDNSKCYMGALTKNRCYVVYYYMKKKKSYVNIYKANFC